MCVFFFPFCSVFRGFKRCCRSGESSIRGLLSICCSSCSLTGSELGSAPPNQRGENLSWFLLSGWQLLSCLKDNQLVALDTSIIGPLARDGSVRRVCGDLEESFWSSITASWRDIKRNLHWFFFFLASPKFLSSTSRGSSLSMWFPWRRCKCRERKQIAWVGKGRKKFRKFASTVLLFRCVCRSLDVFVKLAVFVCS